MRRPAEQRSWTASIAAARRRLPMVEFDGTVEVVGPDGLEHQNRGPVGRAVFRVRNVLVEVWYGKLDQIDTGDRQTYTTVPPERLLKVAYTAAVAVAGKIRA